jgi:tRNA U34 5-carboxymethylaminomethyl modifying GTPase MnmE/TrmE
MDTIVAQATPSGESALAVIRISGDLAYEIATLSCGKSKIATRLATLA